MITNIQRGLDSIEKLFEGIQAAPAEGGKIIAYTALVKICEELAHTLDENYIHHSYTRENLGRIIHAAQGLAGLYEPNHDAVISSFDSSMRTLRGKDRWPSKCMVEETDGIKVYGINDPPDE